MQIYLFGFAKKKNSTAQPVLNTGTSVQAKIKDPTTVTNPVLIFNKLNNYGQQEQMTIYNYIYIPLFLRYYFVTDWKYINGAWEAYCHVDVLASFKSSIGNTSAYIERSASSYNGDLIDVLYPATTDVIITGAAVANSWSGVAPSGGSYIIGFINYQTTNHIGAISYYALNTTQLNSLLSYLFSSNIYQSSTITEMGEDLFKSLFNPFQYIVSCMWFPKAPSVYGNTSATIKVGYWDTGVSATLVNATTDISFVTGTIPDHPQLSRGAYLNYAPYTKITLYCPPFGAVQIDPFFTKSGKYLYAQVSTDMATGEALMNVGFRSSTTAPYNGKACVQVSGMMGVPIQLAQVLSDYSSGISTLTGSASGGVAGLIAGAIGATVQTAIAQQTPKVSTSGSNGSFNTFTVAPELIVEHYKIADEDNTDLGRPLMSTKSINTLSGYIKCAESHFSGNCYSSEQTEIDNFLVSGFFYE